MPCCGRKYYNPMLIVTHYQVTVTADSLFTYALLVTRAVFIYPTFWNKISESARVGEVDLCKPFAVSDCELNA